MSSAEHWFGRNVSVAPISAYFKFADGPPDHLLRVSARGIYGSHLAFQKHCWIISCEIDFRWLSLDLTDDKVLSGNKPFPELKL